MPIEAMRVNNIRSIIDLLKTKWRQLFHRHRGAGSRPIVESLVSGLSSYAFGRFLQYGAAGSFLFLLVGELIGMHWSTRLSITGLSLDAFGVLIVFKEWLLQHEEYVDAKIEKANELALRLAGEPSETIEPLGPDEPYILHVEKHIMDGVRDEINDHLALMLPGIGCLVVGFVFQILAVVLNSGGHAVF